jgi:hypothetical protein
MNEIEKDIWDWIVNYIEVNHSFYDYKFPPCPYAKSARLKGLLSVTAYDHSGSFSFINKTIDKYLVDDEHTVCVMTFPNYMKWNPLLRLFLRNKNKSLIPKDSFIQYGTAITTSSKFDGIGKGKPYFIVIINKLSDVMKGHKELLKTSYYTNWSDFHYYDVVEKRNEMIKKFNV